MEPNLLPRPDYEGRRRQLMAKMSDRGVLVLPTAGLQTRSRDVYYPFRADSDFFYLTGFAEPEAVLVLAPGYAGGEQLLFCRARDPEREVWDGRRAGLEGALETCQVDRCYDIREIDAILPNILENREVLLYPMGQAVELDARVQQWRSHAKSRARQGVRYPVELVETGYLLHEMRLIKDPTEQEIMRAAIGMSAAGHRYGMRQCRPGMHEYQLQAEIEHVFHRLGASHVAYPSIVGAGANACILHYTENRDRMQQGDLVLVDAGAELQGYAGDITRTYPVNGTFSPAQLAVYDLVLKSQLAAIEKLEIGRSVADYHEAAVEILVDGLRDLGILREGREEILERQLYRSFYMHRTGHWLGMDVHDVGAYRSPDGQWRNLEAGMVLTAEPGLYFPPDCADVPEMYRGIGIRIEDDVLVTREGPEILSAGVPKMPADIEDLMALGESVAAQYFRSS